MLLCTKSDSSPQMEILRITFTAEKKYKICPVAAIRAPCMQHVEAAEELEGTVCSSSTSPELIVFCIVRACPISSSHPKASWYGDCFRQTRYTVQTVFVIQIPCSEKSKETRCAHLLVAGLYIFVYISTNEPSSV